MNEIENDKKIMEDLKKMINEGKTDAAVETIATYINSATEENYYERIDAILETLSSIHGGKTVLKSLIEHLIIDVPSLLENLAKQHDKLLSYSFLFNLLKPICVEESDLILPYHKELLGSEDPNIREAYLQLLIFILEGQKKIRDETLVELVASKLMDEQDFVIKKAIQTLIAIGNQSPSLVTRILTNRAKECQENVELKKNVDDILKSIVSVEKIEDIVEKEDIREKEEGGKLPAPKEKSIESGVLKEVKQEAAEIKEKELELKHQELDLIKKKIKIEEKAKQIELEKKAIQTEIKQDMLNKELTLEEKQVVGKEIELKKIELELKKMRLELEEKEKELEAKEIEERRKALKVKEELLEKEKKLAEVELALKKKTIEEKEQKIIDEEKKKMEEKMKEVESKEK